MDFFNAMSLIFYFLLLIFSIWFSGFFFGAPFESTIKKRAKKMIEFSDVKKNEKVVDLGSGNGKIVIEFAKKGIESHGYEINPFLVWWSRKKIKKLFLQDKAFIHWKNFMKEDLSDYDVVCVFQIWYMMGKLERKLEKELKKSSRIVSNTWKFPNWKPKKQSKGIYLYKV